MLKSRGWNYHLITETEGNSVFCGSETVDETSTVEGPQNSALLGMSKGRTFT